MNSNTKASTLTPRQTTYVQAYTDPASATFGNSYQSARTAGYSDQSARNFTPKRTAWMSDTVGQMATTVISPDEIMATLTAIIHDQSQPTIIRLKAVEMSMRAYNMMNNTKEAAVTVQLNIDLTAGD